MSIQWKGSIEDRRVELLEQDYSYSKIAKILSKEFNVAISRHAIKNRSVRNEVTKHNLLGNVMTNIQPTQTLQPNYVTPSKKQNILQPKVSVTTQTPTKSLMQSIQKKLNMQQASTTKKKLFSEKCYQVEEEMCMTPEKIRTLKEIHRTLTAVKPKKILSLSDLHAPFINFDAVEDALLAHADADIVVLNGDIFDGQAMSRFDKMRDFDLETELEQVDELLEVMTTQFNFKYIVWVGGNHDLGRFMKYVMKNFDSSMKKFVLKRLNPMDIMAEKYENLIVVPHDWVQIGDVIFSHLENFNSVDMKTVANVHEIFTANNYWLPNKNYRGIVIGHTHHWGSIIKNGTYLAEQGCLCHLQDYKFHKPTKVRWETGYAVINFDNNVKIDFNETKLVHIEKPNME